MKNVKIVVGANYGDEGKGMLTHYFTSKAQQYRENPIVVFHNGTAQRGHTVDYNSNFRIVYHHFGSGTGEGVPTFFANTFLIHPMEFHREFNELRSKKIFVPLTFCDPEAKVITPFDMLVDRATEEWIAKQHGEREYGSCGYGSWCAAEDRIPMGKTAFTIKDFIDSCKTNTFVIIMEEIWKECLAILISRGVEIEKTSYAYVLKDRSAIIQNFAYDVLFFANRTKLISFDELWERTGFNVYIFENGQGLGLDMDVDNDWHTTSHTGVYNPLKLLGDKDFSAEVCYVSRSYATRHGVGPLEDEVQKKDICPSMFDITNVHNEFQGSLRYGDIELTNQQKRIETDFAKVSPDERFKKSLAITHLNEHSIKLQMDATYLSNDPFTVKENR